MEKVSKLTKKSFENRNLGRAANAALICFVAKRCLGEIFKKSFLREIKIISFRDGVLFIATSNPIYSQEIKLKEKDILEKINKHLGKNSVLKMRFKLK